MVESVNEECGDPQQVRRSRRDASLNAAAIISLESECSRVSSRRGSVASSHASDISLSVTTDKDNQVPI